MPFILGRAGITSRTMGFAPKPQVQLGSLITYSGDGHLITLAPTGTGKTSGPVICNALKHPGQLIVLDMKGEIHAATAEARRAMGQSVHVLDLRDNAQGDPRRRQEVRLQYRAAPVARGVDHHDLVSDPAYRRGDLFAKRAELMAAWANYAAC